nr:bidirectional sugar transporter SWEET7 [Hemerocallis fulva]
MVNIDAIRTTVGIIGNVISFGLFLSPVPTFIAIIKKKAVEQFSPIPYVCTLLNCFLWCLYGLPIVHPDATLVITINGVGIVIELIYISIFVIYAPGSKKVQVLLTVLAEAVFVVVFGILVIRFFPTTARRSTVVGILCIVFNIIMYVSPLSVMKLVIQTKSVEFMPFPLSFASFCNGACWTIYSVLKFDVNIFLPNGIGTLFSVVQLVLIAIFWSNTQKIIAARKNGGGGDVAMTS